MLYLALGDSTGRGIGARHGGYPAHLQRRLNGLAGSAVRLENLCVSGATTATVLRDQLPRVRDRDAHVATLCVGVNDATRLVPPVQFARNLREIVARTLEATDARLVVANVPDLSRAPVIPPALRPIARELVSLYNGAIADLEAHERVHLVDAFGRTGEAIGRARAFFSADGFHPSDEGYELWAEVLWPHVERAWRARAASAEAPARARIED